MVWPTRKQAPEADLRRQDPEGQGADQTAIAVRLSARNMVTAGIAHRITAPAISTTDSIVLANV